MNLPQPGAKYIFALRPAPQKLHESAQASGKMRGLYCGTCYRFRGTYNKSAQARSELHSPFTRFQKTYMNLDKPQAKREVYTADPITGSAEPTITLHRPEATCIVALYPVPRSLHKSGQASSEMQLLPGGTCYRFRGTYNKFAQVSSEMLTPSFTGVAEPVIGSGGTYINLHTSQAKCTVCRAPLSSYENSIIRER